MKAQDIKDSIGWGAVSADIRQQVMDLCDVVSSQDAEIRALKLVVTELAKRAELNDD
jgi:hypothetical protein